MLQMCMWLYNFIVIIMVNQFVFSYEWDFFLGVERGYDEGVGREEWLILQSFLEFFLFICWGIFFIVVFLVQFNGGSIGMLVEGLFGQS